MATDLSVSHSAAPSFLTKVKSSAACAMARQHDPLGIRVEFVRSAKPAGQGRFSNHPNRRGGKPTGHGRGMGQLNRHFNSAQPPAQPSAQLLTQQSRQQEDRRRHQRQPANGSIHLGDTCSPIAEYPSWHQALWLWQGEQGLMDYVPPSSGGALTSLDSGDRPV